MQKHVLQSDLWGKFKESYGTSTVCDAGVLYTKHAIPFTSQNYAYCPKVDPFSINFSDLSESLKKNDCIAIHFDVPNVIKGSNEEVRALEIFSTHCVPSARDEFAKANILMDLSLSEDDLLQQMHSKQRYNIGYAQRKGITVKTVVTQEDFDEFYALYKETGIRQKYYYRPRSYLESLWKIFKEQNAVTILTALYEGKPLASWMLFCYDNVLYYPYGGSSEELKNLQASCLLGWEAIKYGRSQGMHTFDMWGAALDPNDTSDAYHGFTNFKLKFGGKHVTYIDSYDYVINQAMYKLFTTANALRWKMLNALR